MKTYEFYVDENNLHCVVGTTYSMDGYDEMVDILTTTNDGRELEFVEVEAPETINYDGQVW